MKIKFLIIIAFLGFFGGVSNNVKAADCERDFIGTCTGTTLCTGPNKKVTSDDCDKTKQQICCAPVTSTAATKLCKSDLNGECMIASSCSKIGTADKTATDCGLDVCCIKDATIADKPTGCAAFLGKCQKDDCGDGYIEEQTIGSDCPTATDNCCVKADSEEEEKTAAPAAAITKEFANPITANSLEQLLGNLLKALQGVVALVAIIMIVVGGLMYMFAGVDEKMVETAKKTIGGAIIGLAIVFAAPAFLKEILNIVGGTDNSGGLLAGAPSIKDIAERILNLLLSIVGILGIIGLIVGGGFHLTAYGDEDRIKKGKDIIAASLIGLIVAMASLIIVKQIAALFGGA